MSWNFGHKFSHRTNVSISNKSSAEKSDPKITPWSLIFFVEYSVSYDQLLFVFKNPSTILYDWWIHPWIFSIVSGCFDCRFGNSRHIITKQELHHSNPDPSRIYGLLSKTRWPAFATAHPLYLLKSFSCLRHAIEYFSMDVEHIVQIVFSEPWYNPSPLPIRIIIGIFFSGHCFCWNPMSKSKDHSTKPKTRGNFPWRAKSFHLKIFRLQVFLCSFDWLLQDVLNSWFFCLPIRSW